MTSAHREHNVAAGNKRNNVSGNPYIFPCKRVPAYQRLENREEISEFPRSKWIASGFYYHVTDGFKFSAWRGFQLINKSIDSGFS
nr:AlNc14C602G12225 [Albugo laibachii Nc14]|eukprot:CCA27612.1 AlNc14C602G12225 [Albugo laibachii Nc14]